MDTVYCINCDQPIFLDFEPEEGEIILCSNCGTDLEVINLAPTELDWFFLDPIKREPEQG